MDDLAHRLANRVVGNAERRRGARADDGRADVAVHRADRRRPRRGGDARRRVDGQPRRAVDRRSTVPAGATRRTIGADRRRRACGPRSPCAAGSTCAPYLGSRVDVHARRLRRARRARRWRPATCSPIGDDVRRAPRGRCRRAWRRCSSHDWEIGVLVGPHAAPDFLTPAGLDDLLRAEWTVHFNSARTGVRLVGPRPGWARRDGGEAGLHPSNIHDTGYAVGAVDLTGDMPIILGPDGPSLGGFVCPAVVAAAERWKLGQLAPGDRVRLVPWTAPEAAAPDERRRALAGAGDGAGRAGRPPGVEPCRCRARPRRDDGVLGRRDAGRRPPGRHVPPGRRPVPARRVRPDDARPRAAACGSTCSSGGRPRTSARRRRRHGRRPLAARAGRRRRG